MRIKNNIQNIHSYSLMQQGRRCIPIAILFLLAALTWSCGGGKGQAPAIGLEIQCTPAEVSAFQGEKVVFSMAITNHTAETIRPGNRYFISYHLYDQNGKTVAYENRRFTIPAVLRRKKTARFDLPVFFSHGQPGKYKVEFDIVKEGEFWGSGKKWQTATINLDLKPLVSEEFKKKYLTFFRSTGNPLLDNEQYLLRITLKNTELYREGEPGKLFGFSAGSDYPMVWIRDTATFIGYAKCFYKFETLAPMIELFMEHQDENGSVPDWVDGEGKTGKNTVETDQESSLVLAAAYLAFDRDYWLNKAINGQPVIDRLEAALEWVWQNKRDKKYGLITSAFTADWGDIDNSYPDQRATKLSDRSTLVLGIYTQSLYIRAMGALNTMFKILDPAKYKEKIALWNQRYNEIKTNTKKHLYLEDKHYFITHIVLNNDRDKFFKMEKEILPVGGNAEAMIAGLMDKEEIKRFLDVLAQRRGQYKLRTVSFTLLPPYPEGFFPHHLLTHPWNYQNGGEWDWIGARLIKGLLINGFKKEAEVFLLEIVKKNLSNFCIYEWEDRQGNGRGALFYAGAAGLLGQIIFGHL